MLLEPCHTNDERNFVMSHNAGITRSFSQFQIGIKTRARHCPGVFLLVIFSKAVEMQAET
jgi:hypothetical protein